MHDASADTAPADVLHESDAEALLAARHAIVDLQERLYTARLTGRAELRADLTRLDEALHAADESLFRVVNVASSYLRSHHAEGAIRGWLARVSEADES